MGTSRHYSNAPITEAIIDVQVQLPDGIVVSDLLRCHQGQESAYPEKKEVRIATGQFEIGPKVSSAASSESIGFRFTSADQKQIYQARLNGFTMSRLAPYGNWETFCGEARRLWSLYQNSLTPTNVKRLAVRYINRLDLPGDEIDLKDYLRTSPELSPDLPQAMAGFFMQVNLPHEDIKCTCLINETIVEPPRKGITSVVLDIDLFRTEDVPQDEAEMWSLFEVLHDRKNEIFEACITERTRGLIQ